MCLENHHHQLVVEKALENKTHTCYFRCGKCRHTILNQLPARHTPVIHSPLNKNHTHIRFHTLSSQTYFHIYSDIANPLPHNPKERGRTGSTIHIYIRISTLSSHSHIRQSHESRFISTCPANILILKCMPYFERSKTTSAAAGGVAAGRAASTKNAVACLTLFNRKLKQNNNNKTKIKIKNVRKGFINVEFSHLQTLFFPTP